MPKLKDRNAWFKQVLQVAEDPAASGWLKTTLMDAINRDPVSAAEDAEVLRRILQLRAAAVQRAPSGRTPQGNRLSHAQIIRLVKMRPEVPSWILQRLPQKTATLDRR